MECRRLKTELKNIMAGSYLQILTIYIILSILVSFGIIYFRIINFGILALITGIAGICYIKEKHNLHLPAVILVVPAVYLLLTRLITYLSSPVPPGYDPGIYRFIFNIYFSALPQLPVQQESWIAAGYPPGLFILADLLHLFGISSDFLIFQGYLMLQFIMIAAIYAVAKQHYGKEAGIIAALLFSVSVPQFTAFWHMYYKNLLAMPLFLIALYLYEARRYAPFALVAGFVGGVHRPTFLLLLLAVSAHAAISGRVKKRLAYLLAGVAIALGYYAGTYREAILPLLQPLVEARIGPGTFFGATAYEMFAIGYLPFGILGILMALLRKKISVITLWVLANAVIVYLKLAFYNRLIIQLDAGILIFASAGFLYLLRTSRRTGALVLLLLSISSGWMVLSRAISTEPLLSQDEFAAVLALRNTEENAMVMSTTSHYSPWLLGYSGRRVIAPGLFGEDRWSVEDWRRFWSTKNSTRAAEMLRIYRKPLYIYTGPHTPGTLNKFKGECFEVFYRNEASVIYRFVC